MRYRHAPLQKSPVKVYIYIYIWFRKTNFKIETKTPPNFVPFTFCIINTTFRFIILCGSRCSLTPKFGHLGEFLDLV